MCSWQRWEANIELGLQISFRAMLQQWGTTRRLHQKSWVSMIHYSERDWPGEYSLHEPMQVKTWKFHWGLLLLLSVWVIITMVIFGSCAWWYVCLGCCCIDGRIACVFYLLFFNSSHGIYGILVIIYTGSYHCLWMGNRIICAEMIKT